MQIIDCQIHEPSPWTDWSNDTADAKNRIEAEISFAWLDAVGVDGVVLFPGDPVWGAWASAQFPKRLAYVPMIRPEQPDIDGTVRTAKQNHAKGQVGLRAVLAYPPDGSEIKRLEAGAYDPIFAACEKHQVPLFTFITHWLDHAARLAEKFPKLTMVIDHVGMAQPPLDKQDDPPFKDLPKFLALAKYPNVCVKLCGLPSMSREAYPYKDAKPHLRAIVDAYGANRLMWGSDTTRFFGRIGLGRHAMPGADKPYVGKHTYAEALHFILHSDVLSASEKEAILGGSLKRILGWPK